MFSSESERKQKCDTEEYEPDINFFMRSQSPQPDQLHRDGVGKDGSSKPLKKTTIVVKKEFVNRQNSLSRSPSTKEHQIVCSSPKDPKADCQGGFVNYFQNPGRRTQKVLQPINRDKLSKRNQENSAPNYFECNFALSAGQKQVHGLSNSIPTRNSHQPPSQHPHPQQYQMNYGGSIGLGIQSNYPHFNEYKPAFKLCKRSPQSVNKNRIQIDSHQFVRISTFNEKKQRQISMEGSLDDSDDFERQSSSHGRSSLNIGNRKDQRNGGANGASKKFVISKDKVNFIQGKVNEGVKYRLYGNQLMKRSSHLEVIQDQISPNDMVFKLAKTSTSPESEGGQMRRQKSDNSIMRKSFLNHDKSQNYLSLHIENKIDMPKVVKATSEAFKNSIIASPSNENPSGQQVFYGSLILPTSSENKVQEVKEYDADKDGNYEKMELSELKGSKSENETVSKGQNQYQKYHQRLHMSQFQQQNEALQNQRMRPRNQDYLDVPADRFINKSQNTIYSKREEIKNKDEPDGSKERARVSQSLLLDNFLTKKKLNAQLESQRTLTEQNIRKENMSSKSSENLKIEKPKLKSSNPFQMLDIQDPNSRVEYQNANFYGRKSSLNTQIHSLIEEQRANTPIRINQDQINVELIKERVSATSPQQADSKRPLGIFKANHDYLIEKANARQIYTTEEKRCATSPLISSNANEEPQGHCVLSASTSDSKPLLNSANTSDKFKEIIDNMFVPTASAYKKKVKDREFKRAGQNPVRRSRTTTKDHQDSPIKWQKNLTSDQAPWKVLETHHSGLPTKFNP